MGMVRVRSEFTDLEYGIRRSIQPTLHGLLRGHFRIDAASISGVTDGDRIGMILGLSVERKASLGDGKYQYYDDNGNVLASN